VRSVGSLCDQVTERLRRSVGAGFNRETDRICGSVTLCVTDRRTECEERWGFV